MSKFSDWLKTPNNERHAKRQSFDRAFDDTIEEGSSRSEVQDLRFSSEGQSDGEKSDLPLLFQFFGWIDVVIAVVLGIVSLNDSNYALLITSVSLLASGVLLIAAANVIQAIVDTKRETRMILQILQAKE